MRNNNHIDERAMQDAEFNSVAKMIEQVLHTTDLTPIDLRDACYLARLRFERTNVRPVAFSSALMNEIEHMRALGIIEKGE